MNLNESIFLHIINDIEEISESANTYKILKASGLIRQLLIDNNCLVDQINREHKEKILFRVQQKPELLNDTANDDGTVRKSWFGITLIFPGIDSRNTELLNKDNFFKYKLLNFGEHEFSVLEVIKICANKYGGVHSEDIKDEREKLLDNLNSSFTLLNFDCVIYAMHGIMMVCYNALLPLANKIKTKESL